MSTSLTGPCFECSALVSYASNDVDLHTLDCPHCGERACATCQDCGNEIAPADLPDSKPEKRDGYTAYWCEQCVESNARIAKRRNAEMAYEQWCDDEGDRMREEMR